MLGFSRQEQRVVLGLLILFCIGLGVSVYRQSGLAAADDKWQERHSRIYREFTERSEIPSPDSVAVGGIGKKTLVGRIDINSASAEELATLPRIGPATAQRIIEFREKNGPFRSIEEITKVKRIGPKTFERIKNNITIK
jgi:comEA protein